MYHSPKRLPRLEDQPTQFYFGANASTKLTVVIQNEDICCRNCTQTDIRIRTRHGNCKCLGGFQHIFVTDRDIHTMCSVGGKCKGIIWSGIIWSKWEEVGVRTYNKSRDRVYCNISHLLCQLHLRVKTLTPQALFSQ